MVSQVYHDRRSLQEQAAFGLLPEKRRNKVKMEKKENTSALLFDLYGKPSMGQAFPLALQHVVAMIVGCVTPAIIVAGAGGLSRSEERRVGKECGS